MIGLASLQDYVDSIVKFEHVAKLYRNTLKINCVDKLDNSAAIKGCYMANNTL